MKEQIRIENHFEENLFERILMFISKLLLNRMQLTSFYLSQICNNRCVKESGRLASKIGI